MPIIETSPYLFPHLIYDAPVNEKTQKVREMFKVDEATGYPEHYNWRGMARLGPRYSYADPFYKLDPAGPNDHYSQKVTICATAVILVGAYQFYETSSSRKPWWYRPWRPLIALGVAASIGLWLQDSTFAKQQKRNGIILDYARKHPERFGVIERPKLRECLFLFHPVR